MNNIRIFEHNEFGELGIFIKDGKEYFPATECAIVLGYKDPRKAIRVHCKGVDEMATPSKGGEQLKKYIPESDLYRLIIRSKLPAAERFEKWVFEEVLPSIRKFGGYLTAEKIEEVLLNPDTIIKLATDLKSEMEKNKILESQKRHLEETKAQISRKREASAMNKVSQLSKQLKKLTDNEKRVGEYTAMEVAKIIGLYSKNGNPHSQLVSAYSKTLASKKYYVRTVKIKISTGQIVDCNYFNEPFVERLTKLLNKAKEEYLYIDGKNYKFERLHI